MTLTKRGTVVAVAVFTALALFTAACSSNKDTTSTGNSTGGTTSSYDYASLSGTLNGSGSTFQKGFNEAAIGGFADVAPDVTVNYGGGGSGKGKTDLATQVVQWAGTDSLIKDADLPTFKGGTVLYFPTVAAPITLSYNLSGVKELQLSPSTLAKIFSAQVTTWNDPAIAADNPDATLPSTPIVVAHRSDGSGTTSSFTNYLKSAGGSDWTLDAGDTVNWPSTTQAGNGNTGVAQIIKDTAGAIGYVDLSDANAAGLVFASIKNKAGNFIQPTLAATSAAVEGAEIKPNLTYSALNTSGAEAYPIATATYIIVYQKQTDATIASALKGWLNYVLTDGQSLAEGVDFAPLPSSLAQKAIDQISQIQVG
ncbi:MAG: phosphate ABC transporter substrate-binding protein PstS [Acidimicrobiales bacterium]